VDEGSGELAITFGSSYKTSDFIVDTIAAKWKTMDEPEKVGTRLIQIKMDNGPESSGRRTQFLHRMVQLADDINKPMQLLYYPPYHSKYQIPPSFVVKSQAIDIAEVILVLIRQPIVVSTLWRNQQSRRERLSTSEAHGSTTKSDGMWQFPGESLPGGVSLYGTWWRGVDVYGAVHTASPFPRSGVDARTGGPAPGIQVLPGL